MLIEEKNDDGRKKYKVKSLPNIILGVLMLVSFFLWRKNPDNEVFVWVFFLVLIFLILSRISMESEIVKAKIGGNKISTSGKPFQDREVEIEN